MKKVLLAGIASLFALSVTSVSGQDKKSGAIQFETTIDPAMMAEANGMTLTPEMMARMKKVTVPYELLFNATHASYMKVEEMEDSNMESRGIGQGARMMGAAGGNRDYFYDLATGKLTAVFDMADTTYFMDVQLGKVAAGMRMGNRGVIGEPVVEIIPSAETRTIVGFPCKKVTIKTTTKRKIREEEKEIVEQAVVWYTDALGFKFSPEPAIWTEGAVLAIERKGNTTFAKSIEMRKVNARDVMLPKKGTVITAEAFQQRMENMMKAMRERQGNRAGNGVRNIIVN